MSWIELQPLLCQVGIIAILALSLNVICGLTGLLQLGHAGFFAAGAYAAGLYSIYFTIPELGWLNFVMAAFVAVAVACLCALIVGVPCLRLSARACKLPSASLLATFSAPKYISLFSKGLNLKCCFTLLGFTPGSY